MPYDAAWYDEQYRTPGLRYQKTYDKVLTDWALGLNQFQVDMAIALLGLPPGSKVLDLGCGKGHMMDAWKVRGFDVWGVDFSTEALTIEALEAHPRMICADIRDLDIFSEKEFDLVHSAAVLEHIPVEDIPQVIKETCRVGRACFHTIAHDKGEDPSHVSIFSPERWQAFFNLHMPPGMDSFLVPNPASLWAPFFVLTEAPGPLPLLHGILELLRSDYLTGLKKGYSQEELGELAQKIKRVKKAVFGRDPQFKENEL